MTVGKGAAGRVWGLMNQHESRKKTHFFFGWLVLHFCCFFVCLLCIFSKGRKLPGSLPHSPEKRWRWVFYPRADSSSPKPAKFSVLLSASQNHKNKRCNQAYLLWLCISSSPNVPGRKGFWCLTSALEILQSWLLLAFRAEWTNISIPSEWLRGHTAPSASLQAQHDAW